MDNELDELETVKLERDIAINQLHGYCQLNIHIYDEED